MRKATREWRRQLPRPEGQIRGAHALIPVLLLAVIVSVAGIADLWLLLRVHHFPGFPDLAQITYSADCTQPDAGAVGSVDCDPFGRPYNYPPAWAATFRALGIGRDATIVLGVALAAVALAALAAVLLRVRPGLTGRKIALLCAAVASPPMFLMIERGNSDEIILVLLAAAALAANHRWRVVSVLALVLASGLKLYPVGAFAWAVRSPRTLAIGLAGAAAAIGLLALPWLSAIRAATPSGTVTSFGAGVLPAVVRHGGDGEVILSDQAIGVGVTLVAVAVLLAVPATRRRVVAAAAPLRPDNLSRTLVLMGGGTFVTAYLFTTSFDYRLYPLIFVAIGALTCPAASAADARWLWTLGWACVAVMWLSFTLPVVIQPAGSLLAAGLAVGVTALMAVMLVAPRRDIGDAAS